MRRAPLSPAGLPGARTGRHTGRPGSAAVGLLADPGLGAARRPSPVAPAQGADVRPRERRGGCCRCGSGRNTGSRLRRPPGRRLGGPPLAGCARLRAGGPGRGGGRGRRGIRQGPQGLADGRLHDLRGHVLDGPAGPGPGRDARPGLHRHTAGDGRDGHPHQELRGDSGSMHPPTLLVLRGVTGAGGPGLARTGDPVSEVTADDAARSGRRAPVVRRAQGARTRTRRKGQTPVAPSTRSRTRSAWPLWRAYSSIMCV